MGATIKPILRRAPATLDVVARVAGVSPATVSRVVNRSGYVKESTRLAVEKAISQTGYIANSSARTLASQRSWSVGVLMPSLSSTLSLQTIDTFHQRLEAAGYSLLVAGYEFDRDRALLNAERLVSHGIDGLFIISLFEEPKIYDLLHQHGVPFLTNLPRPDGPPFIGYDHRAAGALVVDFIAGLGHRDVAVLTTEIAASRRMSERIQAMRASMETRGITLAPGALIEVPQAQNDLAGGRLAFRALQAKGPLPTAIFASNDVLAAGVIFECNRQGIRVDRDISVMGYGDLPIAEHVTPSLTTIRTPKSEIGRLAAEMLLARIEGQEPPSVTLDCHVVVRESTSRPPRPPDQ